MLDSPLHRSGCGADGRVQSVRDGGRTGYRAGTLPWARGTGTCALPHTTCHGVVPASRRPCFVQVRTHRFCSDSSDCFPSQQGSERPLWCPQDRGSSCLTVQLTSCLTLGKMRLEKVYCKSFFITDVCITHAEAFECFMGEEHLSWSQPLQMHQK